MRSYLLEYEDWRVDLSASRYISQATMIPELGEISPLQ